MSEKKQVLIICRTAAGQMYLGVLLNRIWYSPVLTKTPDEAITMAQKSSFAMVLFDGDIPDPELRPIVALLRNDPSTSNIPLILFMTNDNPALSQSLLALGCAAILTKPLDLAIVYGVLARLSGQPRHTPRIPVKMLVEIAEATPDSVLPCVNISEGGLYLRTSEPLEGGTLLHIRFTLPHDTTTMELTAEVVRTLTLGVQLEAEPGMGVRFVDIPQDTVLRLRNFVQWKMIGDLEWKSNIGDN